MSKLRFSTLFIGCLITLNAYAQTPGAFAGMSGDEPPIMSPGDFTSHVKELGKQTQADLQQEINSQLQKPTPPGAGAAPPQATTPPSSQAPSTPGNTGGTQPPAEVAPLPPAETQPPETQENPQTQNGSPPPAGTIYQGAPTPNQPQPYTGFGAGNNNNTSNPPPKSSNSNAGGGWNIKY